VDSKITWRRSGARRLQSCKIFDLDEVRFEPPEGGEARPFYVLEVPDWINVIAITDEGKLPLVKQYRFGIEVNTVEIPGGMCDSGEEPLVAAMRELREETGYEAARWSELGWVYPNPPVQTNRCYTVLAEGARRVGEPQLDPNERIEQLLWPMEEVQSALADGRINHALVLAAFQLYRSRS